MNYFYQSQYRTEGSNMLLNTRKDKDFLEFLFANNILTRTQFNSWEKPEEGNLFPTLIENAADINDQNYITTGLKSNQKFYRIPVTQPDDKFIKTFSPNLLKTIFTEYFIFPLTSQLSSNWFILCYFYPISIEDIAETLNIPSKNLFFNIISPQEFRHHLSDFQPYLSTLDLTSPFSDK